jgi:molybdopterin/thiamine biosynthesis adenylyltransferase
MTEPFLIDDDDRYSRLRLISWWDQPKLAAARVLVVGAGALGNEVLKNLALVGVGRIIVIDLDRIEDSNLARSVLFRRGDRGKPKAVAAAEAVRDLNPDVKVLPIHGNVMTDLGLGVFQDVDVVIGCLDNREARLWVNRCCWKVGKPWIDGGIQEINGVAKVYVPGQGPCYECSMTENDYRLINIRYSCPQLKREDLQAGKVPTAPTIASFIAALQTQEALKIIHGMPVEPGMAMVFNGLSNQFYKTQLPHRDDCLSHETYAPPTELDLSVDNSVKELFREAGPHLNGEIPWRLSLDRDLVVSLDCACGHRREVMRPRTEVTHDEARCPRCDEFARPQLEHEITSDSPWVARKLSEIGVPAYDILRFVAGDEQRTMLLTGNRTQYAMK